MSVGRSRDSAGCIPAITSVSSRSSVKRERTATVTAVTPLTCLFMATWDLEELVESSPETAWKLLRHVVDLLAAERERATPGRIRHAWLDVPREARRALGRRRAVPPRERAPRRRLARPRPRGRTGSRRPQAHPGRPGQVVDAGARRGRRGGDLLRARRLRALVAGRRGVRGRRGRLLVHLAEKHAHTLRAGPEGLDVLAYGKRKTQGNTVLPRAGVAWMHPSWVDVGGPHPWEREAAVGEPEVGEVSPRPGRIANIDQGIRWELDTGAADLNLGDVVGSVETGLSHMTIPPGAEGYPPHCHAAEEELFVVLEGSGTVMLGDESAEVRARKRRLAARRHPRRALVPRRGRGPRLPRLRDAGAERHRLLPAHGRDQVPRGRRDPPRRQALTSGPGPMLVASWPSP